TATTAPVPRARASADASRRSAPPRALAARRGRALRAPDREHACLPGAARGLHVDDVADGRPEERRPERRVRRDPSHRGDLDLHLAAVLFGDADDRADADVLVGVVLDGHRVIQALAQDADPGLEQPLLVLRGVVLEVLGQVAELARGLDRLHRFLAPRALQLGELGL